MTNQRDISEVLAEVEAELRKAEEAHKTKIVDESGQPLVMYHGTKVPGMSAFDTNRKTDKFGRPNVGAYFSANKEYAQSYGPNLHAVKLDIRNPYVIHDKGNSNRYSELTSISPERHKELTDAGHDGIVYHWTDPEFGHMPFHEVVAFHPHQIQPASPDMNKDEIATQHHAIGTGKTGRHHTLLPVGSTIDTGPSGTRNVGKIKIRRQDGKTSWISVRAGLVMGPDGNPRSSRSSVK
jgi:hypothetical protein